jgi:hypothetical protein
MASWGNREREWWARRGRGWAYACACTHAEAPRRLGAVLGSWASKRAGGGARVLGRGAREAGARPAAPGPWERLDGAFATWAGQGKPSWARGKGGARRGQLGTGRWATEREEGLRVFSFYLFFFLLLFLKTCFSFEFKFKHTS